MSQPSNIELKLASALRQYLEKIANGDESVIKELAGLLLCLEYYIPEVLSKYYNEWQSESLDGFYITNTQKTGTLALELYGWAILLSDTGLTPFHINIALNDAYSIDSYTLLFGEAGGGRLGISHMPGRGHLIETKNPPLGQIKWKYKVYS